jgi:NADH-quinone oxidoreductase subunit C
MTEEKKVPASVSQKVDNLKKEAAGEEKQKPAPKPKPKPVPKPVPVQERKEADKDWQKSILKQLGNLVKESFVASEEFNVVIENNDNFLDVFSKLKEMGFDYLSDISSIDYSKFEGVDKRFGLSYHLYSLKNNKRIRIKVFLDETDAVPSVINLWKTADFHEREAYDLMGISFLGREGLKRILLPEDWVGHPLRKDYKKDEGREEYTAKLIRKFKEDE